MFCDKHNMNRVDESLPFLENQFHESESLVSKLKKGVATFKFESMAMNKCDKNM